MCKYFLIFLLVFATGISALAYSNTSFWVSGSVLWGQGDLGVVSRFNKNFLAGFRQSFSSKSYSVNYGETELFSRYKNFHNGLRFKIEKEGDWDSELSPYIGYSHKNLFSFYHELEYRFIEDENDYFRNRHDITYYIPVPGKWTVKPYLKNSIYIKTDTLSLDKDRVYAGALIDFLKAREGTIKINLYLVHSMGSDEMSWDDQNHFGAHASIFF